MSAVRRIKELEEKLFTLQLIVGLNRSEGTPIVEPVRLKPESGCRCPDFMLSVDGKRVGIEVSEIIEGYPLEREQFNRENYIKNALREELKGITNLELQVSIHSHWGALPSKNQISLRRQIIDEIKTIITNDIHQGKLSNSLVSFDIPRGIKELKQPPKLSVFLSKYISNLYFHAAPTSFGVPVLILQTPNYHTSSKMTDERLKERVEEKSKKAYHTCRHIDSEVWLLLRARYEWSWSQPQLVNKQISEQHTFQRIYILEGYEGIVIREKEPKESPSITRLV